MSDYTPPPSYPWVTDSPEFDSETEEKKDLSDVPPCSGIRNINPYRSNYPEPYWDKRRLPFLYENITAPDISFDEDMVDKLRTKPTTIIQTPIYSEDGKKTVIHNFEWKVLNIGPKAGLTEQKDIDLLYSVTNFCNVYWLGAKHNNRLKRGTKVYMVKGSLKGKHGTIVGHVPGFSVFKDPRSVHRVRVLLVTGCIEEVRQDYLRLVDLYQELPLGIPKPLAKKRPNKGWDGWDKGRPWTSGPLKKHKSS